ncbi:hypothetical protein BDW75DRAFT_208508 [Aspergillus navahoensis]
MDGQVLGGWFLLLFYSYLRYLGKLALCYLSWAMEERRLGCLMFGASYFFQF